MESIVNYQKAIEIARKKEGSNLELFIKNLEKVKSKQKNSSHIAIC